MVVSPIFEQPVQLGRGESQVPERWYSNLTMRCVAVHALQFGTLLTPEDLQTLPGKILNIAAWAVYQLASLTNDLTTLATDKLRQQYGLPLAGSPCWLTQGLRRLRGLKSVRCQPLIEVMMATWLVEHPRTLPPNIVFPGPGGSHTYCCMPTVAYLQYVSQEELPGTGSLPAPIYRVAALHAQHQAASCHALVPHLCRLSYASSAFDPRPGPDHHAFTLLAPCRHPKASPCHLTTRSSRLRQHSSPGCSPCCLWHSLRPNTKTRRHPRTRQGFCHTCACQGFVGAKTCRAAAWDRDFGAACWKQHHGGSLGGLQRMYLASLGGGGSWTGTVGGQLPCSTSVSRAVPARPWKGAGLTGMAGEGLGLCPLEVSTH